MSFVWMNECDYTKTTYIYSLIDKELVKAKAKYLAFIWYLINSVRKWVYQTMAEDLRWHIVCIYNKHAS